MPPPTAFKLENPEFALLKEGVVVPDVSLAPAMGLKLLATPTEVFITRFGSPPAPAPWLWLPPPRDKLGKGMLALGAELLGE